MSKMKTMFTYIWDNYKRQNGSFCFIDVRKVGWLSHLQKIKWHLKVYKFKMI